jgi:hypothetical protein
MSQPGCRCGRLQRASVRVVSVNNARNPSVHAIYHAVFASVSSAKQCKDHLIHQRSQTNTLKAKIDNMIRTTLPIRRIH